MAFNDHSGPGLTHSCLVVIPIIRAELSTVCELHCLEKWSPAADRGTHTRTQRPCKGHMCSRWQVYLFWDGGSPTASTKTKRRGETLRSHVPDFGPPASEHRTGWGMFGIQLNMSVWGLGRKSHMSCEGRCPDLKLCQRFMCSSVIVIFSNREDDQIKSGLTDRWNLRVPWSGKITSARCYS